MTPPTTRTHVLPLEEGALRRVVGVLCFTEIVSWGVLFYAFTVLAAAIRDAEGWPLTHLVAVFTLAQVVAAAAGLWVGRHLDRHGPRVVMTGGSVLGVVAVTAIALAPTLPLFAAAWVLAGVAMSATLYPPAFAAVTHWAGDQRVRALTAVTLVAGLASTVFAPLAALLLALSDWRTTYLLLGVVLASTAAAHWWGLTPPWAHVETALEETGPPGSGADAPVAPAAPLRRLDFGLLVVALTLGGFCVYAVVVNLVPLLLEGGLSTGEAAVALGVGGVGQVAGRLLYAPVLARVPVRPRTVAVLGAGALTTVALAVTAGSVLLACAASFAAGTARGVFTLIQATAVTDRWGTAHYGRRSGVLSGAVVAASAFAPWVGALLAALLGGYVAAFLVLALAAAASSVLVRPVRVGQLATPPMSEPRS